MRNLRAAADVADIDWPRLIGRRRREAQHVGRERKVAARSTGDTRHVLHAMTKPEKDMVKPGQQLQKIFRQLVSPDLGDEAGRLAAALAPVGNRRERIQFEGVAEDRKKQFEIALQGHLAPRRRRKSKRKPGRSGRQPRQLIGSSAKLERRQVGCVDALGTGNGLESILELVGEAKRDQVGNPALR